MMSEQNCFNCTRREGFICFGLSAHEERNGVDMREHTAFTDYEIKTENDLKKIGEKCFVFIRRAWSVS